MVYLSVGGLAQLLAKPKSACSSSFLLVNYAWQNTWGLSRGSAFQLVDEPAEPDLAVTWLPPSTMDRTRGSLIAVLPLSSRDPS